MPTDALHRGEASLPDLPEKVFTKGYLQKLERTSLVVVAPGAAAAGEINYDVKTPAGVV